MKSRFVKYLATTIFATTIMSTITFGATMQTTSNVNFRTGPSTNYNIITLLKYGTAVDTVETVNDWTKVTYNGTQGYIKSEFLSDGTVVNNTAVASNSPVLYQDWSTVKNIFTKGVDTKVLDVYSGKIYYVRSFSNGLHADVEPVTPEDTRIMKETFNNVWSWDVRPVWVYINGQAYAASINGMPHGGGVNNNNNMSGQVCIHFKGSSTHNGNASFTQLHQQKALEAYNYSLR